MSPRIVPSTDGVDVVVHELGGSGPTLLMSHATGFHGLVWRPVAGHLVDRFSCLALDYRGHGDTVAPADWSVTWEGYGDDAAAVASSVREPGGILGIGHSMGGACLLMAAHRDPSLFRGLVVFEPVVIPTHLSGTEGGGSLAAGARRRRDTFPSFDDAIANYASKPPMGAFTVDALDAYVHGGFAQGADGQVHLKCRPDHEAQTFEMGGLHRTWDLLAEITCPVVVAAGRPLPGSPGAFAEGIAERLPAGRYVQFDDLDHFGPMTDPARVAALITDLADSLP